MDAWILDESPGSYRFGQIERPSLASDEVSIKVVTSALNHMDIWVTKGAPKPHLPHVPGCDVAGIIAEVGSAVTGWSVGDEVVVNPGVSPVEEIVALGNDSPMGKNFAIYGEHTWGGHCQFAVAPARNLVRKPRSLSWEEAAAYPLAYLTAYRMLRRARLTAGNVVLVVGIGSGVSTAALALARHMGAVVYVTSRDVAKREEGKRLGAVDAFDSADSRWPVQADIVVESVGPATFGASMGALKPGGRLVLCGGTSGNAVEISLPRMFFKQLEIIGSTVGSYEEFATVTKLMDEGVAVVVDEVFEFADYDKALARLQAGAQLGKIVLQH
jgi:zinc-binding alcohol dehydrogenase/oxidoreductase